MMTGQFRTLVRKYGFTAMGTYFTISATTFWTLYVAIENNVDVKGSLQVPSRLDFFDLKDQDWGLLPSQTKETEQQLAENTRWYKKLISEGKGGSIALAFLCTKALVPIKIPVAMSLTPTVHKCLTSLGLIRRVIKHT